MSEQEEPSVRITLTDIYRIVEKTNSEVTAMRSELKVGDEVRHDHEVRIRAVERKVWALPSIATVLGLIGIALSVLKLSH